MLALGERLGDSEGEALGLWEAEGLKDGLSDGDSLALGLKLADGEREGLSDGDSEGLSEGEGEITGIEKNRAGPGALIMLKGSW